MPWWHPKKCVWLQEAGKMPCRKNPTVGSQINSSETSFNPCNHSSNLLIFPCPTPTKFPCSLWLHSGCPVIPAQAQILDNSGLQNTTLSAIQNTKRRLALPMDKFLLNLRPNLHFLLAPLNPRIPVLHLRKNTPKLVNDLQISSSNTWNKLPLTLLGWHSKFTKGRGGILAWEFLVLNSTGCLG